ncbi:MULTISPECIES: helix-turn-helix transcriptional regulator [Mycolicibacterium]|uniref:helix-turn-helix transcriptional regulator n=1 Tax=Mycolicibacterium TaxID=1866885 RepID=UPI001CE20B3F|nr:AraC family transcriptional regulator [Mycolicibacterium fortuitum]MCA4751216.1 helix-turn-helix transcriptional regulator [Mycolicibacterium fortuitum]MDG5773043.1 AraC family transcriptional regulator [Mycolicibacterium fortuitum]MDG5783573.1 AraC family transcriptional regulator [Mycolicibacterium fortuitum]MDG5785593.1 AraC family transcriptional regulator [Mycolicibacterium fortuitum]
MEMKPWDGDRPLTPRVVLEQKDVAARGLAFTFGTEQISEPTDWCSFSDTHHLVYVYRGGAMHSMQTALDWGPSGQMLPTVGDIWWKPAGVPCAALVQGEIAGYCEIALPRRAIGDTALLPRIKYRDPLMHHLVEEIYSVADRDDAIARLLTDSVAETMRLLIRDKYAEAPPKSREHRTFDIRTRAMLVDYLNDSLDSDIHLDALAQLTGMSVQAFIGAFRRAFHTTPYQFLLDLRIDRAKTLLLTTQQTVAEIASSVGFSTPSHFATAFRRRVGISPSIYRHRC